MNDIILASIVLLIPILVIVFSIFKRKKVKPEPKEPEPKLEQPSQSFLINPLIAQTQSQSQKFEPSKETETVKKITLNVNFVLAIAFFAFLTIFTLGFIDKKNAIIFFALGSGMFIPIGLFIGIFFSGNNRIKFLRYITRKNIGYVKFIKSNNVIKPVIANLDNDIIRYSNGIYIVNKKWIKKETPEGYTKDSPINEEHIKYEDGIPTIYFDIDDLLPVDFDNTASRKLKSELEKFRIPSHVSATLNKEIAVEKAKVMNAFAARQNIFMIVVICLLLVIGYMVWTNFNNIKSMLKTLDALKGTVQTISNNVEALKQLQTPNIIFQGG